MLLQKINFLTIGDTYGLFYFIQRRDSAYKRYQKHFFEVTTAVDVQNMTYKEQLYISHLLLIMFKESLNIIEVITGGLLLKDLIHLQIMWRLIKGYGTKGQRTHANNKMVKKNRLLHNFRLQQFFKIFGQKKRNIYPTLIIGEYTNKLWFFTWYIEWLESSIFALSISQQKTKKIPFDPVRLAKSHVNGFTRVGAASKISKAKQVVKTATLGVPIFFTRCIYNEFLPKNFPYPLLISDEDRRKMGRKSKKNKPKVKKK